MCYFIVFNFKSISFWSKSVAESHHPIFPNLWGKWLKLGLLTFKSVNLSEADYSSSCGWDLSNQ